MKTKGFTIVEMLTVVGIIAILVGVLIPSLAMVRNAAKNAQQRAQLATLATGLEGWRNDFGRYPPSGPEKQGDDFDYTGSQRLTEAMLGWDLLGFHPDSEWQGQTGNNIYSTNDLDNRRERKGLYIDLDPRQVFQLGDTAKQDGIYGDNTGNLAANTFVITDVFGAKSIDVGEETVRTGTPVLYYRANLSSRRALSPDSYDQQIYNFEDNEFLVRLGRVKDREPHRVDGRTRFDGFDLDFRDDAFFYEYIRDPRMTNVKWPYRPDSYLLISAGADGIFGTEDDITNF